MATQKKQSIRPDICKKLLASPEWIQYKIVKTFEISSKNFFIKKKNGKYLPSRKGPKAKFIDEHTNYVLELAFLNSPLFNDIDQ